MSFVNAGTHAHHAGKLLGKNNIVKCSPHLSILHRSAVSHGRSPHVSFVLLSQLIWHRHVPSKLAKEACFHDPHDEQATASPGQERTHAERRLTQFQTVHTGLRHVFDRVLVAPTTRSHNVCLIPYIRSRSTYVRGRGEHVALPTTFGDLLWTVISPRRVYSEHLDGQDGA